MKYELTVTNLDNTKNILIYDTELNTLHVKDTNQEVKYIPNKIKNINDKDDIMIRLSMGKQCNFKCVYCHQTISPYVQKKIPNLVDKLIEVVKNTNKKIKHVQFWGGEPLVFFNQIKNIIEEFENKLPKEEVPSFGFCTNGSLLKGEIGEYVLEKNISFTISHDGTGQFLRGPDPLKDKEVLNTLKSVKLLKGNGYLQPFNPVMTKYMDDLFKYIEYIENIIEDKIIVADATIALITDEKARNIAIEKDKLPEYSKRLYKYLVSHELPNWNNRNFVTMRILQELGEPDLKDIRCFITDKNVLTIDLEGNILTCQSFNYDDVDDFGNKHGIDHLFNINNLNERKFINLNNVKNRRLKNCKNCLLRNLCKGGCPFLPANYEKINCQYLWYHNLPMFMYIIHELTNRTGVVTEINPYILPNFN